GHPPVHRAGERVLLVLAVQAQADTAVRVVLITGGDACFTSGNDILDFLEQPPSLRDSPVGRFMSALLEFPKPVIAAVNGPA
ncbi:enoyl-CoA hydratase-related protein, partial [Pseudomonas aeruginosa]